ncbi:MAG: arginine--tRNA ligase [bacterium]
MAVEEIRNNLVQTMASLLSLDAAELDAMFEAPRQREHGDLALPCFKLAKQLRQPPPKIAADLEAKLKAAGLPAGVEKIEQLAGYLNFTFAAEAVAGSALQDILSAGESYGSSTIGKGQKVVLEYSSVNIAKPFGIGHLRSTIIGAALARVHQKLGFEVVRINHLGDWGTQFGKLIAAYRLWGSEIEFGDNAIYDLYQLYVRFHEAAKDDPTLEERGREEFRKLEAGDPDSRQLWQRFHELSMRDFNRLYALLKVEFDYLTGESFYEDKMGPVLQQLQEKKLLIASEGAEVVNLDKYEMPACLMRKSDGATLYATRDLAALLYRKATFDFDRILYIVGSAQELHFRQFFKVAELMGYDWVPQRAQHVGFGWVKFSGQMMSTREGTLVFVQEVIDRAKALAHEVVLRENPDVENVEWISEKVAVAALVFTQLRVRRNRDVNFIWEDALSFRGDTGPYLQYTHARLSSLARKYGKTLPDVTADLPLLGDEEKQIIKLLGDYPERVQRVLDNYETSVLTDYLLELAGEMNSYWQRVRIITDDGSLTKARMQMAYAVRIVIADGLRLLGIEPLERM